MLELTGCCCSGTEAISFMEGLEKIVKEEEKTDEFYMKYEKALNRFRYEVAKGIGKKKKVIKAARRSLHDLQYCGKCGFAANEPSYKYCPNCGTAYIR